MTTTLNLQSLIGSGRRTALSLFVALAMALPGVAAAQGLLGGLFLPPIEQGCYTSGGYRVHTEVQYPSSGACDVPAVIILHGSDGLEIRRQQYRDAAKLMASEGYVAIIVSYFDRGGRPLDEWNPGEDPVRFQHWVSAARDAVRYAQDLPGVDEDRVALSGFSLGGFVATSAATNNSNVAAVVTVSGGLPAKYAAKLHTMAPALIIHGEADDIVPVSEAHRFGRWLDARDVDNEVVIFQCVNHYFTGEASKQLGRKVTAFLRCNL